MYITINKQLYQTKQIKKQLDYIANTLNLLLCAVRGLTNKIQKLHI